MKTQKHRSQASGTATCGRRNSRYGFMLMTVTLGLIVGIPAMGIAIEAPLDTLPHVVPPSPEEAASANLGISRTLLPDIEATSLPRSRPPQSPPRFDDPVAAELRFLQARRAAESGDFNQAEHLLNEAVASGADRARVRWWQVAQALERIDPAGLIWALPKSVLTAWNEPLASPRLLMLAHQGLLVFVTLFWAVVVGAYLAVYWRYIAHDLAAINLRDHRRGFATWTPLFVVVAVVLARPGVLGGLALLSIPLMIQARGRNRSLLLGAWLATMVLVFPNWPPLREAVVTLDPGSETVLLGRASTLPADPALIADLRERLADAEQPARRARLQTALAIQEARRGRFTDSSDLYREALGQQPDLVPAIVGLANNAYFQSRYDDAVGDFRRARDLAPTRGEIPYNLAQVYFKKLFVPEAGQALQDARDLGFEPPVWEATGSHNFSPVVYLGLERTQLRASAHAEAAHYPPLADLAAWNAFLGAPPLPPFLMLGGLLVVALLLTFWWSNQEETRNCDNCGVEICRDCCLDREGAWLCHACGETANRARSEMVLATLLKNRSRAAGLARSASLCRLARFVPGAGYLALGETGKAVVRIFTVACGLYLAGFAWTLDPAAAWQTPGLVLAEETIHPTWLPLPIAGWPGLALWPVGIGVALLALVALGGLIDAVHLRQRLPERLIQGLTTDTAPGPGRP